MSQMEHMASTSFRGANIKHFSFTKNKNKTKELHIPGAVENAMRKSGSEKNLYSTEGFNFLDSIIVPASHGLKMRVFFEIHYGAIGLLGKEGSIKLLLTSGLPNRKVTWKTATSVLAESVATSIRVRAAILSNQGLLELDCEAWRSFPRSWASSLHRDSVAGAVSKVRGDRSMTLPRGRNVLGSAWDGNVNGGLRCSRRPSEGVVARKDALARRDCSIDWRRPWVVRLHGRQYLCTPAASCKRPTSSDKEQKPHTVVQLH
ncbi:Protein of unknown function [Gryllus bimaculatus]|nr:Protein of unknown function [Gryllus bimaculatus]